VKFLRPTRPLVKENRALQAVNARLTKKLKNAELIIEVQKKKWLRCWVKKGQGDESKRQEALHSKVRLAAMDGIAEDASIGSGNTCAGCGCA